MSKKVVIGYGYRRSEKDMEFLQADVTYVDWNDTREERTEMLGPNGARKGEIIRVLATNDLGGSDKANKKILAIIKRREAVFDERRPPEVPKKMGRPRKFDPTPDEAFAIWRLWTDQDDTGMPDKVRLQMCQGIYTGKRELTRELLNGRYGWPSKPKPAPETKE